MIPTREDLIVHLTKHAQASVAVLCEHYACAATDLLRALKSCADFEACPPRPEDGKGFAWRLSSLSVDPDVRAAAFKHQRTTEQPPQRRPQRQHRQDTGAERAPFAPADPQANVLVVWMRANPGKWTIDQIAQGRGCTRAAVREHLKHRRHLFATERLSSPGRPLVVWLKDA